MTITIFQSDKGDCLMVTSEDGRRMMVDGGMRTSYTEHVAPTMGELREQAQELDLVYVSHIDRDHVFGVLQMLDDLVAWRVHDFQIGHDNPGHPEPRSKRPPEIKCI